MKQKVPCVSSGGLSRGRCERCEALHVRCSLVQPRKTTRARKNSLVESEEPLERKADSPKKSGSVQKVISSIKNAFSGSESGKSPEKSGASELSRPHVPVNRAEVVLNLRTRKASSVMEVDSIDPRSDFSSFRDPPRTGTPSVMSTFSQGSRYQRGSYEIMQLREELNASREELALYKKTSERRLQMSAEHIRALEEQLESQQGESSVFWNPKGKGKGKQRE